MRYSFVRAYPNDLKDTETDADASPSSKRRRLPSSEDASKADNDPSTKHFVVSVDFGTTFSAISFVVLRPGDKRSAVDLEEIESISKYSNSPGRDSRLIKEVPTESCYPRTAIHRDARSFFSIESKRALEPDDDTRPDEEDSRNFEESAVDKMDIDDEEDATSSAIHPQYRWGFDVHQHFRYPDADRMNFRRITRSKLLLHNSEHTRYIREQLQNVIVELKSVNAIQNGMNFIVDYLIQLLAHAKLQLQHHHNFKDTDSVEFVLCVPVMWTRRACRRMQNAIREASYRSRFGRVISDSLESLYIVSEPEAAAACILAKTRDIEPGDTFMILDAGGGTVDAITYRLKDTEPLKMEREAVKPEGVLCGSSYLNERFEQLIRERLEGITYFNANTGNSILDITVDSIIDDQVYEFEQVKKDLDVTKETFQGSDFKIAGLRPDAAKKFAPHRMILDRDDFNHIFLPCLNGVSDLMLSQLESARGRGIIVKNQKVLLVGGFAESPSLYQHLKKILRNRSREIGQSVELLYHKSPETAIATGAILRALNPEQGPTRIIGSSYGFLRTEPHEPECIDAHKYSNPKRVDPIDGERYVKNTIFWILKKGDEVPPFKEFPLQILHIFPATPNQRFLCEEVLYVSDKYHESHYKKGHRNNKGAQKAGKILMDMTFLRTEGHIKPIKATDSYGKHHYRVEYELVMIVDGFNIKYEARWNDGQQVRVMKRKQINIAAAFASLETDDDLEEDDDYLSDFDRGS